MQSWDRQGTDINKIARMIMFFRAAKGENYTGLSHTYQDFADGSHWLSLRRAVLVGRIERELSNFELDDNQVSPEQRQAWTYVRICIPVGEDELRD